MQETINLENLYQKIDSYKDESIKMQEDFVAIPALSSVNGGDGELKKSLKIKEYMDKIGYDSFEEINAPDDRVTSGIRPNHIYRMKGKNSSRTIWIMSHIDVVPPGEARLWNTDPYKIKVDGDLIYGRGTEDNHQGMISSILAFKALKEMSVKPEYDVALLFVSDEETHSDYGIKYILKQNKDIFTKDDIIIIPDAGKPDSCLIEVAEKSILWMKFTVTGKQTHASRPNAGVNAFKAGSVLVMKLYELNKIFGKSDPVFSPPTSTFEPTKKEPNVPNANTIPGEDVFYYDCRILPDYNLDDILKKVDEICREVEKAENVKISYETPTKEIAAPVTAPDADVVKRLAKSIKAVTGRDAKPMGVGGGTVAAYIRKYNYPAVVWTTKDEVAHQANEYCKISYTLTDAKIFLNLYVTK